MSLSIEWRQPLRGEPTPVEKENISDPDELEDITDPDRKELLRAFGTMTLENEESMRNVFNVVRTQMRAAFPEKPAEADKAAVRSFQDLYFMESSRSADALTGLYNLGGYTRRGVEALKTLNEQNKYAAIIRFDLSGLKGLNDNFGHHAGNLYLQAFAQILEKHQPPKTLNLAARLGGDEFALFLTDTSEEEIQTALQNIATDAALIEIPATHLQTGEKKLIKFRKPYIGVAVWSPGNDESFTNLDHRADVDQVEYANTIKAQILQPGQIKRSEDTLPSVPVLDSDALLSHSAINPQRVEQLLTEPDTYPDPLKKSSVNEIDFLGPSSEDQAPLPFEHDQAA